MGSPTQRSLAHLRKNEYLVQVVEKYNIHARVRVDLFGFIDIVAVKDGITLGVQSTSYSNISARVKKILEHENFPKVKAAGWRIIVQGWKKNKSNRWELVEREV